MSNGSPAGTTWDFTTALSFISSRPVREAPQVDFESSRPPSLTHSDSSDHPADSSAEVTEAGEAGYSTLGNFDKVWRYLGTSAPEPTPTIPVARVEEIGQFYKEPKSVTWKEGLPIHSLSLTDDQAQLIQEVDLTVLTKTQRKKERRRLRKEQENATLVRKPNKTAHAYAHPFSEGETDTDTKVAIKRSQERQNIIHDIVSISTKKSSKVKDPATPNPHDLFIQQVSSHQALHSPARESRYFLRSQDLPKTALQAVPNALTSSLADSFEKKKELMGLLYNRFRSDWSTLAGIQYSHNNAYTGLQALDPAGVHIFIDLSNILIGFHDALKAAMGKPKWYKLPRQKLSFHNLSLVLERGRPVAKRCLAGSDNLECVEDAKLLGYDTFILERVHKAKELTPRQRYFAARDAERRSRSGDKSGASSGGEATGISGPGSGTEEAIFEPVMKRVEQCVDELLHLKMMESMFDYSSCPSTIVLATGDAAEAEYSQGFLAMCERALNARWKVEVIAFKQNMSSAYRKKEWVDRWNGRFKVIELDEFVQKLHI